MHPIVKIRASSTLQNDQDNFGSANLLNSSMEKCWSSMSGQPQSLTVTFEDAVKVTKIDLLFQGGFSGKSFSVSGTNQSGEKSILGKFYAKDNNNIQSFFITNDVEFKKIKIKFNESWDFYGRIVLYSLEVC